MKPSRCPPRGRCSPSITVANIVCRAAQMVGLAVVTAACAHGQVEPSAPRIHIAVAPISFGPENGLTPEEQAECELGKRRRQQD